MRAPSTHYSADSEHDARIALLAELGIAVGVNLQPGQALVVKAPLEAAPFVRQLTEHAYRRGASVVTCLYDDPAAFVARLTLAEASTLDSTAAWLPDGVASAISAGTAYLQVLGPYPDLLEGVPMERTIRLHRSLARAARNESAALEAGGVNASAIPFATQSWARSLAGTGAHESTLSHIWNAILTAARADRDEPEAALTAHLQRLDARRAALTARNFRALHCRDGETDLRVGLVPSARWAGGTALAGNGIAHAPALPAEDVFAATDPYAAEGRLTLSRPLALAGGRVTDACLVIADGRVVSVSARSGQQHLEQLLAVDDHAGRIGEIGLVPASAPLAARGAAFSNPMLDRLTGCHIAFGRPEAVCVTAEARESVNRSSLRIDVVFGRANLDVDGIDASGRTERIISHGEFLV